VSPAPVSGPPFDRLLETCLYHDTAEAAEVERFYVEVLGLRLVARWPDGMVFRVGAGVLLLFDRELLAERSGPISDHGTTGPGHACLAAGGAADYEAWMGRLEREGVEVTHEHAWSDARRSIYFKDPAGNLLEIADGDLWPEPV
jgi:catechol 2,3-dioxygenase-like lactoylglutathione lyase family enzyme